MYECACGRIFNADNYLGHFETKYHQNFIDTGMTYKQLVDITYPVTDWRRYKRSISQAQKNYYLKNKQPEIKNGSDSDH